MLGLMFVPTSKRYVSLDRAQKIAAAVHDARKAASVVDIDIDINENAKNVPNEPWFTAHARRLASTLSTATARPLLVGVFQNQPLSTVLAAVTSARLDLTRTSRIHPTHENTARHKIDSSNPNLRPLPPLAALRDLR